MSISSTKLNDWCMIDSLSSFPSLINIRLSHIPLFTGKGASEVRPHVIGRVSKLQFFNGSTINIRERLDAEKIYLRHCMRDIDDATRSGHPMSDKRLNKLHPLYFILKEKHGADLTPLGAASAGGNIASELLNIQFNNLTFSGGASNEPVNKKLPASITIEKLKIMISQLFNLKPELQQLSLSTYKDSPPTLLEDDSASLIYYGTQDGAKLFINEAKDTAAA